MDYDSDGDSVGYIVRRLRDTLQSEAFVNILSQA